MTSLQKTLTSNKNGIHENDVTHHNNKTTMANKAMNNNNNNNNRITFLKRLMLVVLVFMGWHSFKGKPATPGNKKPATSMRTAATATTKKDSSPYDETVLGPFAQNALNVLQQRHHEYKKAGIEKNWHLRGIAHLYLHRNVLLVGRHIVNDDENENGDHNKKRQQHSIRIDNVYNLIQDHSNNVGSHKNPTTSSKTKPPACIRLAIWVRVAGPEIFAGKALAVGNNDDKEDDHCYWKFDFDPVVPGQYKIMAKVLMWDSVVRKDFFFPELRLGEGDEPPKDILEKYPTHAGFKGFKMYAPERQCSNACSRQLDPPCRYWRSPPYKIQQAARHKTGCEFFFDANATVPFASWLLGDLPNVTFPKSRSKVSVARHKQRQTRRRLEQLKTSHGFPQTEAVEYYLGCGWSPMYTLDFPCLSGMLDDQVYLENVRIQITPQVAEATNVLRISSSSSNKNSQSAPALSATSTQQQRPLCSLAHETITSFPSPQANNNTALPATGRWVPETWPNSTQCPLPFQYDPEAKTYFKIIKHDGNHPHCYHRDNLHEIGWNCVEMNCRFIQEVSIHRDVEFRDTHWMGTWKPYECDLLEYTNSELQQCVDELKIREFTTQGASIARQYQEYLLPRIKGIKLYQGSGGRKVVLSTNRMLHALSDTLPAFLASVKKMPNMTDEEGSQITFISGAYFLSSVRDISDWESMAYTNKLIRDHLIPKGYKYIDTFDMSAAMTFDTASQMDGMHLVGPVPKMVLTKFFHYLCKDVVKGGTRL